MVQLKTSHPRIFKQNKLSLMGGGRHIYGGREECGSGKNLGRENEYDQNIMNKFFKEPIKLYNIYVLIK